MKVLSVRQPWAGLIVEGVKPVENRTWATRYRGPLAIHAGARWDDDGGLEVARRLLAAEGVPEWPELCGLTGGVIGMVELVDCVSAHPSPWFFGPFGFVLTNASAMPFERMPGRLGLFEVAGLDRHAAPPAELPEPPASERAEQGMLLGAADADSDGRWDVGCERRYARSSSSRRARMISLSAALIPSAWSFGSSRRSSLPPSIAPPMNSGTCSGRLTTYLSQSAHCRSVQSWTSPSPNMDWATDRPWCISKASAHSWRSCSFSANSAGSSHK
jgi:hypothetical protein